MCRVLVGVMDKDFMKANLKELMGEFVESSRKDPHLAEVTRGRREAHDDGWGLAVAGFKNELLSIFHEKTAHPIFSPQSIELLEVFSSKLSRYDKVLLELHSRATGTEPLGTTNAHPFEVDYGLGKIWFIHNGGVDKVRISKEVGINPYLHVDSYVVAKYLARRLSDCAKVCADLDQCVASAYSKLYYEHLRTGDALITGLLTLCEDSDVRIYFSSLVRGYEALSEEVRRYYLVYRVWGQGFNVLSSSTLVDYYLRLTGHRTETAQQRVGRVELDRVEVLWEEGVSQ
ncbi:MAG: class II glutamine amidotransferase [Zestosphaera sp.]